MEPGLNKTRQAMDEVANEVISGEMYDTLKHFCFIKITDELINRAFRKAGYSHQIYTVGSNSEGIPYSAMNDEDMMIYNGAFPIVWWKSQEKDREAVVMAEQDSNIPPVYLRLKVLDKGCLDKDFKSIIDKDGYLNATDFIKLHATYMNLNYTDEMRQGPSISINAIPKCVDVINKHDSVYCLKCQSWPPFISDFFFIRKRLNNWPAQKLLDKVKCLECHVVPVGYPGSESFDVEWRLSFSVAEKQLVIEMYEPYNKCMFALKSIKKKYIIYSDSDKPTPFSSYFIKTACLWMCETFPYRDYSLMDLIRETLDWLIDGYKSKHLPHYFIPQHNLIGHLSMECCDNVRETLTAVKRTLWSMVLLSASDDHFTFNSVCDKLKVTRENNADYNAIETKILNHPKATAVFEERVKDLRHNYSLQNFSNMSIWGDHSFTHLPILVASQMQPECGLGILEDIVLPIVDLCQIEEIVPEGFVEMFKTCLYRYLGDAVTHLLVSFINRGYETAVSSYMNDPLHYYDLGYEIIFPGRYSDYGIVGEVLEVQYHYLMGNYEGLKKMCESILTTVTENKNYVLSSLKFEQKHFESNVCAWEVDELLHHLVICCHKMHIYVSPIALVYYIKARVLLKEGDTDNVLTLVKKMKIIYKEFNDPPAYLESMNMFINIIESLLGLLGVMRRIFTFQNENSL
ncbi:uncharacterized protein LOC117119565 [Anneissia japonica]|uniref:uncharacterized protein LOC117119565 n=1 Tax=Anneissia japonica TaxID=1529436 RepID=UPI001425718F|nr:uncharacterized protein LOC117119565 [Anneissia japonica]